MKISQTIRSQLVKSALNARLQSYSPYSNCKVGSAVLTQDSQIFIGCNVENASYGATVCAERTAIFNAIAHGGLTQLTKIQAILVVTDSTPPWPPCGICRQVLSEFCDQNTIVMLSDLNGKVVEIEFSQLYPLSFNQESLRIR